MKEKRSLCHLIIMIVTFDAVLWGYIGYMKYIYKPPAPVPCTQGMILWPGQTCYFAVRVR